MVAAVEGFAVAGGLEIALSCDLIVGDEPAVLGLPEVTVGVIPGGGGTQLLYHLPRLFQSLGNLCEPARTRRGRSFIRHSNHADPPVLMRWSVTARVNFALGRLRSGAEIV